MFDIDNYWKIKEEVKGCLKKKFPNYDKDQGFVLDGLLDPEEYSK